MTIKTPYAPSDGVKIPNLDPFFGPDAPPLPDPEPMPDGMQQNPHILYVMQILAYLLTDRLDTFADTNTIVYYDPTNRNWRLQPDVYVAFDVDASAIRRRNGYLIWEVGKPPDVVLEVALETTASNDVGGKRDLYARMGVAEYWRFDASGGDMYGAPLVGEYLERGEYRAFPVHTAPDGAIWAYSPLLQLNLRWYDGEIELQDPDTGEILLDRRGVRLAMATAVEAERQARLAAERELEEYRELVRQLRENGRTQG
jgi:Uma2 family endonuclease